ncbi:unnamed protein product [Rotaria sp. Silwood2]|nr:unnamed protein product [Rotaria sp. Silwood2]CAF4545081.1 unnamed protein product [Rotaria sp. Silwood2]
MVARVSLRVPLIGGCEINTINKQTDTVLIKNGKT